MQKRITWQGELNCELRDGPAKIKILGGLYPRLDLQWKHHKISIYPFSCKESFNLQVALERLRKKPKIIRAAKKIMDMDYPKFSYSQHQALKCKLIAKILKGEKPDLRKIEKIQDKEWKIQDLIQNGLSENQTESSVPLYGFTWRASLLNAGKFLVIRPEGFDANPLRKGYYGCDLHIFSLKGKVNGGKTSNYYTLYRLWKGKVPLERLQKLNKQDLKDSRDLITNNNLLEEGVKKQVERYLLMEMI